MQTITSRHIQSRLFVLAMALSAVLSLLISLPQATAGPAPADNTGMYLPLPLWSAGSPVSSMLCGEFYDTHPGMELAIVLSNGNVIILTDSAYRWSATPICTVGDGTGIIGAVAGDFIPSAPGLEIAVATPSSLYLVSCINNTWEAGIIGDNSTMGWGRLTCITSGVLERDIGQAILVSGTAGKVVEVYSTATGWNAKPVFLSPCPIDGIAIAEVYTGHPGNELLAILGGQQPSLVYVLPYSDPTGMCSYGWTTVPLWKSPLPLQYIAPLETEPGYTTQDIVVVSGAELDTGPHYSATEIYFRSNGWMNREVAAVKGDMAPRVGSFNSSWPGSEMVIVDSLGSAVMYAEGISGPWAAVPLWSSARPLVHAAAGDFSISFPGGEVAVADDMGAITLLTETQLSRPEVAIISPYEGEVTWTSHVRIDWQANSLNGVGAAELYWSQMGGSGPWILAANGLPTSGGMYWEPQFIGEAWLAIVVRDTPGLVASDTVHFTRMLDTEPPVITHEPAKWAYRNEPLVIVATVTDQNSVSSVNMYYRPFGQAGYESVSLNRITLDASAQYAACIPASALCGLSIDYYISSEDLCGNSCVLPIGAPETPFTVPLVIREEPPVLTFVTLTPAQATIKAGEKVTFLCTSLDQYGNPLTTTASWSVSGNIGDIAPSGIFTATKPGGGTVTVTSTRGNVTIERSASVSVIPAYIAITGTVQDRHGAPIQGARVAVLQEQKGVTGTEVSYLITSSDGRFTFTDVPFGYTYTVRANRSGYLGAELDGIAADGMFAIVLDPAPVPPISVKPQPLPTEAVPTAVIASVVLGIAGIAYLFSDPLRYKLLWLLAPLYSKIEKDRVLDNFIRGQVYGHIMTNPGTHYSKIRRVLGIKNGSLAHHLRTLEKSEFIKSRFDGKFKRFYPAGVAIPDPAGVMLSDPQARIMDVVKNNPGITQSAISRYLNIKKQVTNYHIKQLVRCDVLRIIEMGRETRCYAS